MPKHIAPLRSQRSLKRAAGRRAAKPLVLIACEGHTERHYFEVAKTLYRLPTVEIPADATGSDPLGLVNYIERRVRDEGPFEHIVCAFDRDSHSRFDAARARIRELANGRKPIVIREAISVPCIEFWFLLHFERTSKPFANAAEVIAHLKEKGHIPDYEKADVPLCQKLLAKSDAAIANARWLGERAKAEGFINPATNVHEILDLLKSLARPI